MPHAEVYFSRLLLICLLLILGCPLSAQNLDTTFFAPSPASEIPRLNNLEVIRNANWQLFDQTQPDSAEWWLGELSNPERPPLSVADSARYLFQYGQVRFYQQDMRAALNFFQQASDSYAAIGDSSDLYFAESYRQAAEMQTLIRMDFGEAVENYHQAIALFEYQQDTLNYLWSIHTLAQLYGNYAFYELAEEERSIVFRYEGRKAYAPVCAVSYLVSAIEDHKQGLKKQVLDDLAKAGRLIGQLPDRPYMQFFLYRFYTMYYYYEEMPDSVNYYHEKQLATMEYLGDSPRYRDHLERDSGMWHYVNKRYAQAKRTALASMTKARERGEPADIVQNLELLKKIEKGSGNYALALEYAAREKAMRDSIQRDIRLTQSVYYENLYEKELAAIRRAEIERELNEIEFINRSRIRKYVFIGLLAFLMLLLLYAYRNYRTVDKQRKMQTQFSQDLLNTRAEERKRIALELHDRIGHDLLLVKKSLDDKAGEESTHLAKELAGIISNVRSVSHELYDPGPEELGFKLALIEMVDRYDEDYPTYFDLQLPGKKVAINSEVKGQLFKIIQEALQNAVKHAGAKAISIRVWSDQDQVNVRILDNGTGFKPGSSDGVGLRSIRERCSMIGARLKVNSEVGKGTDILVQINVKNE